MEDGHNNGLVSEEINLSEKLVEMGKAMSSAAWSVATFPPTWVVVGIGGTGFYIKRRFFPSSQFSENTGELNDLKIRVASLEVSCRTAASIGGRVQDLVPHVRALEEKVRSLREQVAAQGADIEHFKSLGLLVGLSLLRERLASLETTQAVNESRLRRLQQEVDISNNRSEAAIERSILAFGVATGRHMAEQNLILQEQREDSSGTPNTRAVALNSGRFGLGNLFQWRR